MPFDSDNDHLMLLEQSHPRTKICVVVPRILSKAGESKEKVMIMPESFISPRPTRYDHLSSPPIIRRTNRGHEVNSEISMTFIPIPSFEDVDDITLPGEKSEGTLEKGFVLNMRRRLTPCCDHIYSSPLPVRRTRYEVPTSPPKMRRSRVINYECNRPPAYLCLPSLCGDTPSSKDIDHTSRRPSMNYILNVRRCSQKSEYCSNEKLMRPHFQPLDTDRTTNVAHHNTMSSREKEADDKITSSTTESKSLIQALPVQRQNKMAER